MKKYHVVIDDKGFLGGEREKLRKILEEVKPGTLEEVTTRLNQIGMVHGLVSPPYIKKTDSRKRVNVQFGMIPSTSIGYLKEE
ncbi:hypothetical protein CL616_02530 [archaeon]|nr:hypothetical protein [archaeon]|tara:strand:+ start:454 stop:702 length:249 start_codon:yes stop_codon:yes gene_type:complete